MNFKKVLIITILIFTTIYSGSLLADDSISLNCKSAVLLDFSSGKVIYEMNSHEKLEPASVTKIMTMLLTMESLESNKIKLNDKVIISKNASKMTTGTRLMLEEGEIRSVEDLLYGIAVESGNDASIAMAEHIAGSEEAFVNLMNRRAKDLNMNDTNFVNPHGLHAEGHKTSAHDIGIMSKELVKHNKIFDYISKYMITVYVGKNNDVKRELVNKNKLVHFYKDIDGIKTGFTEDAMYCISITAKRNNLRLISVIMGAPSTGSRNQDARKLIEYGFANYVNYSIGQAGDQVRRIKVTKGDSDYVNGIFLYNADVMIRKGEEGNIEKFVHLPDQINAPISKGQKIGEIILKKDGKNLIIFEIVSDKAIKKASFIDNIRRAIKYWFR